MLAQFRKWMKKEQGFTLIELMVVIVILGVLAGIGIPQYQNFVDRAFRAELEVAYRAAQMSLELYRIESTGYPDPEVDLVGDAEDPDDITGTRAAFALLLDDASALVDDDKVTYTYSSEGTSYELTVHKDGRSYPEED